MIILKASGKRNEGESGRESQGRRKRRKEKEADKRDGSPPKVVARISIFHFETTPDYK